jgi:hypothetical protein
MKKQAGITARGEPGQYLDFVRRVIKAAGRRVSLTDPEDLAKLITIRAELDEAIQAAVDGLRADGFTWKSIGEATGTTGQAANMKWGRPGGAISAENVGYVEIDTKWAVDHSRSVTVGE